MTLITRGHACHRSVSLARCHNRRGCLWCLVTCFVRHVASRGPLVPRGCLHVLLSVGRSAADPCGGDQMYNGSDTSLARRTQLTAFNRLRRGVCGANCCFDVEPPRSSCTCRRPFAVIEQFYLARLTLCGNRADGPQVARWASASCTLPLGSPIQHQVSGGEPVYSIGISTHTANVISPGVSCICILCYSIAFRRFLGVSPQYSSTPRNSSALMQASGQS